MTRSALEHLLRAAAAITNDRHFVVIGSQAILGQFPQAPDALLVSIEADLYPRDALQKSDLIDGAIGELSAFHETFGYYAHGVGAETAILPSQWRDRAVTIRSAATGGVTGICPDPSDLAVSKLAAWREKDRDFVATLMRHGITTEAEIEERLTELDPATASTIRPRLRLARAQ